MFHSQIYRKLTLLPDVKGAKFYMHKKIPDNVFGYLGRKKLVRVVND